MNTPKKVFVLGLGNQKCGTSWLHRYLLETPQFKKGFKKEYHIWDALDIDILARYRVPPLPAKPQLKRQVLIQRMQTEEGFYFDYFNSLYSNKKTLTADITPSYCGLDVGRLRTIKAEFNSRDIVVKPVIFIREPLSRIRSAVRYNLDKSNYKEGITKGETAFEAALEQYYTSPHCVLRTRYKQIIENAIEVFGRSGLYIGIFESMFTPTDITRLSNYLGIDAQPKLGGMEVNKTKTKVLETSLDDKIINYYADVYDYCYRAIPATQDLWRRP